MTRAAALAPLLVGAMTGAVEEVDAPPIVTHQGMITTYRSHDQMMAAFAADMATGKWECDDEDRQKLAEWQAARIRKASRPYQARRQRSRTSHRRATRGRSTRPSRTDRERNLAPRTIYNIYTVVAALFRDAKLADLIEQSPCILDERQLGPLVDKDPEWRNAAVFARDEVETIISDARIPADRQMVYALELLAGVRPGEAAALRWRHYDPNVTLLGKTLVAKSYNTRGNVEKTTKTDAVKHIPVHPVLAAMLAQWKRSERGGAPAGACLVASTRGPFLHRPLIDHDRDLGPARRGGPLFNNETPGDALPSSLPLRPTVRRPARARIPILKTSDAVRILTRRKEDE